jgi:chemotaxis protein MotB
MGRVRRHRRKRALALLWILRPTLGNVVVMARRDDDATRQVDRHQTDDVFEIGDSHVVEVDPARTPRKKGGSALAGVILGLALLSLLALYVLMVRPAESERDRERAKTAELQARVTALETERNQLRADADAKGQLAQNLAAESQKKDELLKELEGTRNELEDKLKEEITRGDVLIKQGGGELVVDLADQILFPSGEADLNDKGKEVLRRVGETMLKVEGKVIQVGGHTDDLAISDKLKTRFPSNWELSSSRALNVVHFLEDDVKVPGERLVAAGFSQYRPVAKNKTKEGRKKNRRIEVILLPLKKG